MIWLTGNRGMLGRDVESLLKKDKFEYFATDIDRDITDFQGLKKYTADRHFDHIINCSAYTDVDMAESEEEKAYSINGEGVKNLALIAKEKDAVLIHISTDYVFNGKKKEPYTETDTVDPISVYGKSKLKAEEYIQDILNKYYILRTSWLFGRNGKNFVHTILRLFQEQDEINVVDDQYGSPTYSRDLAEIIIEIIKSESNQYGIYHFTNKGLTTWYEFAETIYTAANNAGLCDKEVMINPIKTEEYPLPAGRPEYSLLSKEKIIKIFKIKIRSWQKALGEFIGDH